MPRSYRSSRGYAGYELMRSGRHVHGDQFRWMMLQSWVQQEANSSSNGTVLVRRVMLLMERARHMSTLDLVYQSEAYLEEQQMYQAMEQMQLGDGNNLGSPMEISTPVNTPIESPDIASPPDSVASGMSQLGH
ncbi:hypothetical protein RhiJN_02298 [Ceratobasidium sp. AG-Ba]|nr:hypothetical protein RhiJN_02298 [Ceratobasidium sp. AG-Ba]